MVEKLDRIWCANEGSGGDSTFDGFREECATKTYAEVHLTSCPPRFAESMCNGPHCVATTFRVS